MSQNQLHLLMVVSEIELVEDEYDNNIVVPRNKFEPKYIHSI